MISAKTTMFSASTISKNSNQLTVYWQQDYWNQAANIWILWMPTSPQALERLELCCLLGSLSHPVQQFTLMRELHWPWKFIRHGLLTHTGRGLWEGKGLKQDSVYQGFNFGSLSHTHSQYVIHSFMIYSEETTPVESLVSISPSLKECTAIWRQELGAWLWNERYPVITCVWHCKPKGNKQTTL